MGSYFVCDPSFEVAGESSGFTALQFTVLDWFTPQIIIQLYCKNGCSCTLILSALLT